MGLIGTIALIVLLVAFRLFLPPAPGLISLSRRFGKRSALLLFSIGLTAAAAAIFLTRR